MLVLYGSSVFSPGKRDALLANIQSLCPTITSVDAVHLHLISCVSDATEIELSQSDSRPRQVLDYLLAYGDDFRLFSTSGALASENGAVYVVPRPGSVSPWSSKATDIARLCDLGGHVERLERGSAFVFTPALSQTDLGLVAALIHDRMTQIATLTLPPQDAIFRNAFPSPLCTVQLVKEADPRAILERANKDLGLALAPDEIVSRTYLKQILAALFVMTSCS
jgi:phosphoribosylformylglycinamidine synthase